MKINKKKTQLLVISPQNGFYTSASMRIGDGERIGSIAELKLVGFHFGTEPNANAQVGAMRAKFLEYCTPVYHPLLNAKQVEDLERMHRQAIRICFGFEKPEEEVREMKGIENLRQRRVRRMDSFIRKSMANPRLKERWFPLREDDGHNLRRRRLIQEAPARTLRMFKSLLAFMRRRANEMDLARNTTRNEGPKVGGGALHQPELTRCGTRRKSSEVGV